MDKKICSLTAALLLTVAMILLPVSPAFARAAGIGQQMPVFDAADLDGNMVHVGDTGTVYVLNFWASWCPPCRDEFPELNDFVSQGNNVQYYGINIGESAATISGFLQSNGYQVPVLCDFDQQIADEFGVRSLPTTIVTDDQGIIRYRKVGPVTKAELETVLADL